MTCAHVLGVIDAGPFAEYPREHRDAARAHARQCPTCGPALALTASLAAELSALPGPDAPSDFASIVMARIAQLPAPGSATAPVNPDAVAAGRTRDWAQPVTAVGGLVAALALVLTMPWGTEVLGNFVTPRFNAAGGLAMLPSSGLSALAIGLGLLLYVTGLFAPVRSES